MQPKSSPSRSLAAEITRESSRQTFYTIRYLVDRQLVPDAYRAYAYFRWVDDCLDAVTSTSSARANFLQRQQFLLEACYRGELPGGVSAEEQMLVDLVAHDPETDSGLQSYLRNMMAVMVFDVGRRDRMISQVELSAYSRLLAIAVTEAMHYFIGHQCPPPCSESRYLAVRGAHVMHMLRDMKEDAEVGYFNIPKETCEAQGISLKEWDDPAYRNWVWARVKLARSYFQAGREYLSRVNSLRCRLAGFAYIARFEWMARAIERDDYRLRAAYPERKSLRTGIWIFWRMLSSMSRLVRPGVDHREMAVQVEER